MSDEPKETTSPFLESAYRLAETLGARSVAFLSESDTETTPSEKLKALREYKEAHDLCLWLKHMDKRLSEEEDG